MNKSHMTRNERPRQKSVAAGNKLRGRSQYHLSEREGTLGKKRKGTPGQPDQQGPWQGRFTATNGVLDARTVRDCSVGLYL